MRLPLVLVAVVVTALTGCNRLQALQAEQEREAVQSAQADQPITGAPVRTDEADPDDPLRFEGERHLRNVRQLTFGGNNAEAYWSPDGDELIFQSDWDAINPQGCDQQFVMSAARGAGQDGARAELVSTGRGRTTCGYFLTDDRVVYASTHAAAPACPTTAAERTGQYVWDVFDTFDIYVADADGSDPEVLIGGPAYDAEATVSPDGRFVIFTSTRSGDLELWRYEVATGDLLQLTDTLGYDGGAFFSPDGSQIVWRASRPTGADAEQYRALLAQNAVQPGALDLYVADADGSNARRVTSLPGANWAPFFHPSGRQAHLRDQPPHARPGRARVRPVPGRPRRRRPGARDLLGHVRRLRDVLARRDPAGVRLEPEPDADAQPRHQRVRRRLGRVAPPRRRGGRGRAARRRGCRTVGAARLRPPCRPLPLTSTSSAASPTLTGARPGPSCGASPWSTSA